MGLTDIDPAMRAQVVAAAAPIVGDDLARSPAIRDVGSAAMHMMTCESYNLAARAAVLRSVAGFLWQ